jgi:glycosyltransferase involved in cell wall biosynthesis
MMITVANLVPYKGHADLIRALGRIKGELDKGLEHGWTLLCAGRDDGILWDLVRLARQEGIDGNVRFLGSRRDVPDLLKASDIGLLCSHEEGFPNAVIEGMAAGLPMIVTAVGGNSEAVTHDETGQIVPPKDPAAIAAAILRYLTEPQLAERCARASRARVEQAFSLPASAAAYDKLYTGLLAGRSVADLATPAPAAAMTAPVAPAASPAVMHPQR